MDLLGLNFKQVITYATRRKRDTESHKKDYYFTRRGKLFQMFEEGKLVEEPVKTGKSFKGTSKKEIAQVLNGISLVWRIDIKRAADVATGDFFYRNFEEPTAKQLIKQTNVVFIDVEEEVLWERRAKRAGLDVKLFIKRHGHEFRTRDEQERTLIQEHLHKFPHIIKNENGMQRETVNEIERIIKSSLI